MVELNKQLWLCIVAIMGCSSVGREGRYGGTVQFKDQIVWVCLRVLLVSRVYGSAYYTAKSCLTKLLELPA